MATAFMWDAVYGPWNVAMGALVWVHFVVAAAVFVRRRWTYPICGQEVTIAFLGVFSIVLDHSTTALTGANSGEPVDCITTFFSYVLLTFAMNCYLARAWRLWFEFYAADERVRGFRDSPTQDREDEDVGDEDVDLQMEPRTSLAIRPELEAEVRTSGSSETYLRQSAASGDYATVAVAAEAPRESLSRSVVEMTPAPQRKALRSGEPNARRAPGSPGGGGLRRQDSAAKTWFAEHRRWARTGNLLLVVTAVTAVQLIAPIVALAAASAESDSTESDSGVACPEYDLASTLWTVMFLGSALFMVYTIYRLRHVHDGFHIKRQLRNMIFWGVIGTALSTIVVQDVGGLNRPLRVVQALVIHLYVWETLTHPAWLSYTDQRSRRQYNVLYGTPSQDASTMSLPTVSHVPDFSRMFDEDVDVSVSMAQNLPEATLPPDKDPRLGEVRLRDVLQDGGLLRDFAAHLKEEFSIENLLFYFLAADFGYACGDGNRFDGIEDRNRQALLIYSMFIWDEGFYQVNLDGKSFATIREDLESHMPGVDLDELASDGVAMYEAAADHTPVSATLYERCRRKVYVLMERDSFVRFKKKLRAERRYVRRTVNHDEAVNGDT